MMPIVMLVLAQMPAEVPAPVRTPPPPVVVQEAAPPVLVEGKRANQLSDDEIQEFLQRKVINITHEDGQVQLIRVAPGYPVSISFQEQYTAVVVGDPGLIKTDRLGRSIVLTALQREGDTSVQVFFPGNRLRIYHVFVAPNFLNGLTAVRVAAFTSSPPESLLVSTNQSSLDLRSLARVISNYDALVQEKALDPRQVERTEVFRTNPKTGFTIYYLYRFSSKLLAISFAYQNPYDYPIRYDESRLRVVLGNVRYIPDYVSLNQDQLPTHGFTTGFTVIKDLGFDLKQPLEIAWK